VDGDSPHKQRIPGARKTKGREISGHTGPIEQRTWQDTRRAEEIDRTMRRNGRLEPHVAPPVDAPRNLRNGFKRA
jgi:hypothetical protein